MAVRIRLMRTGKKKNPHYRIVAMDTRVARNGRYIDSLGYYDPKKELSEAVIDKEKVLDWLKTGAQPSETVKSLLKRQGIDPQDYREALKKKKKKKEF